MVKEVEASCRLHGNLEAFAPNQNLNWICTVPKPQVKGIYFSTAPTCTTTISTLEPCALNAEFQHFVLSCNISLKKCAYFADTTERWDRRWKEAQSQVKTGLV
jgi:hypothetical protein